MTNQMTVADFDQALEDGAYAFPGGYPRYFVCIDGEALSFEAAQENAELIRAAIRDGDRNETWRVIGVDVNWEDAALFCCHTNERIPSAYAE